MTAVYCTCSCEFNYRINYDTCSNNIHLTHFEEHMGLLYLIIAIVTNLKKAVDYTDIRYYKPEDDRFHAVKKQNWYIRS